MMQPQQQRPMGGPPMGQMPPQQPPQQPMGQPQQPPQGQMPAPPQNDPVTRAVQSTLPDLHTMAQTLQKQGVKGMPLFYALQQHQQFLSQEGKQQLAELTIQLRSQIAEQQNDIRRLNAAAAAQRADTGARGEDRRTLTSEGGNAAGKATVDRNESQAQANLARAEFIKNKIRGGGAAGGSGSGGGGAGAISDEDAKFLGEARAKGDTSALTGLGYGKVGAANRAKVTKFWREASGEGGGANAAATDAEYQGTKAGERAIGTRSANIGMAVNEASKIAPMVLEASNAVDRTKYPDVNKILQAGLKGTGDPAVVRLGSVLNSYINVYARAIGGGNATVSDKEHAREVIAKEWSKGQIAGVIDIMTKEIEAAQASPGAVRKELRSTVTGKGGGDKPKPTAADLAYLKAHPEAKAQFEAHFGPQ